MPRNASYAGVLALACLVWGCSDGSTDDGMVTGDTDGTSGGFAPQAGDYEITITRKTGMCRSEEEKPKSQLDMPLPAEDGAWTLTEDYAGEDLLRQEPYPCDLSGDFAICGISKDRNYNDEGMGVAANVTAKRNYEFQWTSKTEFEGLVTVDLRCVGSSCADIAPDYLVNAWDCFTTAEFTGIANE